MVIPACNFGFRDTDFRSCTLNCCTTQTPVLWLSVSSLVKEQMNHSPIKILACSFSSNFLIGTGHLWLKFCLSWLIWIVKLGNNKFQGDSASRSTDDSQAVPSYCITAKCVWVWREGTFNTFLGLEDVSKHSRKQKQIRVALSGTSFTTWTTLGSIHEKKNRCYRCWCLEKEHSAEDTARTEALRGSMALPIHPVFST